MSGATRPCDNPFNAQRIDALDYIEFDYALSDLANRLRQRRYRGAICGPHGCGKTAMLQALGDQLMEHGLTPLPLFINSDQRGTLPIEWQRTIGKARHTDALLLDGYDLLPAWARLWVLLRSRGAGGVVVTTHRDVIYPTIAQPYPSPELLRQFILRLAPSAEALINVNELFTESQGNLRDAMRRAYDLYPMLVGSPGKHQPKRARGITKSRRAG